MKTAVSVAMVLALILSVIPAIASDTFHAFSSIPAVEQVSLTPLSNDQLAAVEGKYLFGNQNVQVQILHLLWGILLLASMGNTDHGIIINIHSVFQMQWDTGGAIQTNMVEVRQQ